MVKCTMLKEKFSNHFKNSAGDVINLKIQKYNKAIYINVINESIAFPMKAVIFFIASILCCFYYYNNNNLEYGFIFVFIGLVIVLTFYTRNVKEESLTVIDSLGYQITTNYIIGRRILFIPNYQVQSVFINEVFHRWKVLHVLTIKTKDDYNETKLVPVFLKSRPRLQCLELIYQYLKNTR